MPARSGKSTKSNSARDAGPVPPGSHPKMVLTRRQLSHQSSPTGNSRIRQSIDLAGPFGCSARGRPHDCVVVRGGCSCVKNCVYLMWADEIVGMVAKRAQLEELPQISGKSQRESAWPFMVPPSTHSHLALHGINPLWPFYRLFEQLCQGLIHSTEPGFSLCTSCAQRPPPRLCWYCSRSYQGHMWRDTCTYDTTIISGSFLLDDDKHAQLAPPRSQPPGSLWFSCALHAYARVSIRHVYCFYQMRYSPSASLVRPLPPSFFFPLPLVLVNQSHIHLQSAFLRR
jgi:hypothetical protein